MKFNFKVSKNYLLASALNKKPIDSRWEALQNKWWQSRYRPGYGLLSGTLTETFLAENIEESLEEAVKNLIALLGEGKETEEFKTLYEDTLEYKNWAEKEWESKRELITKHLESILRVDTTSVKRDIIVIHPKLKGGRIIGPNLIAWGHSEDWPNYSIVYLVHETLHGMFELNPINHGIIELIADNELRLRLNLKDKYFYVKDNLVGHKHLLELEKKMLPHWKKYLREGTGNIFDFVGKMHSKFDKDNKA